MRDSDTYMAILDEGRDAGLIAGEIRGVRQTLLRMGRKRFGEPSADVLANVQAVDDLARLGRMSESILDVVSWQDLLRTP